MLSLANDRYSLISTALFKNIKYYMYIAKLYLYVLLSDFVINTVRSSLLAGSTMTANQQSLNTLFRQNIQGMLWVITLAIFIAPFLKSFYVDILCFPLAER